MWGDDGRAGRPLQVENSDHAPWRVKALQWEWVVAVSTTATHIIAVTRGGSVFGWGDAAALGLPFNEDDSEDVPGVPSISSLAFFRLANTNNCHVCPEGAA